MAVGRLGANGTRIRKMFEGRWVKTIVLIRPIRSETGTATRKESAAHTLLQKRIAEAVGTERWNAWNSHRASNDWTKNPPPNASRLNSAARRYTIDLDSPNACGETWVTGRASTALDSGR